MPCRQHIALELANLLGRDREMRLDIVKLTWLCEASAEAFAGHPEKFGHTIDRNIAHNQSIGIQIQLGPHRQG